MRSTGLNSAFGLITMVAALAVSGAVLAQQATLERVKKLGEIKVCVDQDNLPYSSDKPDLPGFDVEMSLGSYQAVGL